MAIRIHFNPASQHSRRVRMAAIELGVDVEWQMVDFMTGQNRSPEYLRVNPAGKVPTLEHDGLVLWESNAVMAYLADQKTGQTLYPTDARGRADVNRWLFWESAHFGPAAIGLTWERVMKPAFMKQEGDPVLIAQAEQNFARFGAILNAQLETREYVTGSLSLADLALASILSYRTHAKIDTAPFTHLERWIARMEARESWKATPTPF